MRNVLRPSISKGKTAFENDLIFLILNVKLISVRMLRKLIFLSRDYDRVFLRSEHR